MIVMMNNQSCGKHMNEKKQEALSLQDLTPRKAFKPQAPSRKGLG